MVGRGLKEAWNGGEMACADSFLMLLVWFVILGLLTLWGCHRLFV